MTKLSSTRVRVTANGYKAINLGKNREKICNCAIHVIVYKKKTEFLESEKPEYT